MTQAHRFSAVRALIEAEQAPFPAAARLMADAIRARHGNCVRGFLFYGSARREGDAAGRMVDFYVIVDRYRSIHGRGLGQLASVLVPPSVHFLEIEGPDGERLRSKYAVMSGPAFHRRTRGGAYESMLWARFAQPTLVEAETPEEREALIDTISHACLHLADETLPLLKQASELEALWQRGLKESYRTELRPESPDQRTRELVARFDERYRKLTDAILGADAVSRQARLDEIGAGQRFACRARWTWRRILGKIMAGTRVMKAAFTFEAGLDYVLEKIEGHSDAKIQVSERERRHPLLFSPVIAWKLFRARVLR